MRKSSYKKRSGCSSGNPTVRAYKKTEKMAKSAGRGYSLRDW